MSVRPQHSVEKEGARVFDYQLDEASPTEILSKEKFFTNAKYYMRYPISLVLWPFKFVIIRPLIRRLTQNIFARAKFIDFKTYETGNSSLNKERTILAKELTLKNGVKVRNRLVKAGITDGLADSNGNPTEALNNVYDLYSKGGYGIVISPSVSVDRASPQPAVGNAPILDEKSDLKLYTSWASAMKGNGTLGLLQLTHPGALVRPNATAVSPSPFISKGTHNVMSRNCKVLSDNDIEKVILKFEKAVELAEKCGFDGIEIQGGNGYLVSAFMSKNINKRKGKWKGDAFVVELMQRLLTKRNNDNFVISIKINSSDFQKGGLTHEEAIATIEKLAIMNVDFIEIGGGTYQHMDTRYAINKVKGASSYQRESFFIDFAEKLTNKKIDVPFLTVGGWKDVEKMADAIEKNPNMMIGFGRAGCIDPILGTRLLEHNVTKIPSWFELQRPQWITDLATSPDRGKRSVAYSIEMLWHSLAVFSLAKGDKIPKVNGILDNQLSALGFKVFINFKSYLPKFLLDRFFKEHPLISLVDRYKKIKKE